MIASRVHAVIAAGLEKPQLLTLWRQEPDQLRKCGVDPVEFDLDALWKFAGLTAKVRHNGLRPDLPQTFRLLNVAGLEIEVFASYASSRAATGAPYANTTDARAQDLCSFLEHWLDFDKHEHALLWDMLRHELALMQLSKRPATVPASSGVTTKRRPGATSVPRVCDEIILHEMRSDPRVVEARLQEKLPRLAELSLGTLHFCYWRRDATEIQILKLNELGFYLLMLADGDRTARDLSQLLGGTAKPAGGLLQALDELAALGVISFDTSRKRAQEQAQ